MKKTISFALVLGIFCAMLSACASKPVSKDDDVIEIEMPETTVTTYEEATVTSVTTAETTIQTTQALPRKDVMIYLPDDNGTDFRTETLYLEDTPDAIINAMIIHKIIPEGCSIISMDINDNDGKRTIVLDMSSAYGEAVSSSGTTGETFIIYSIVNTMIKAYDADEVILTADGEFIDTGHTIYDWPLTFRHLSDDYE